MTREEAIKILKIKQECSDYEGFSCGINMNEYKDGCNTCIEAIDMAIKALQEKEKVIAQLEELRDDPIMHCSEDYWEGHYQAAKEAIEIVKGGEQECE